MRFACVFWLVGASLVLTVPCWSGSPAGITGTQSFESESPADPSLWAVWMSSSGEAFAVGRHNIVHHFDGSKWRRMETLETGQHEYDYGLLAVWGSSGTDVIAVGTNGTVAHFNGDAWTVPDSSTEDTLLSVWGSSSADVFAGGVHGTILHFDGQQWSSVDVDADQAITGIWGSGANDVFAVGRCGTILHFDGSAWNPMTQPSCAEDLDFEAVWGTSSSDVYAVGQHFNRTTLWHFDGTSWESVPEGSISTNPFRNTLLTVWGSNADDVWTLGNTGTVLHYDGTEWTRWTTPEGCFSVSGRFSDDVWAVGGNRFFHFDGTEWSSVLPMDSDSYLIPAVARTSGAGGSFFSTEVEIHNTSYSKIDYELEFVPREGFNATLQRVKSGMLQIGGPMTVRHHDVLRTLFGLDGDCAGSVVVRASPSHGLIVTTRVFAVAGEGTFGQGLPGLPFERLIATEERWRLPFITETNRFRSNLGLASGTDGTIRIYWAASTEDGQPLDYGAVDLPPFGNIQLNRFLSGQGPITGAFVDVWTLTPAACFAAYVSVLDNETSDPLTVYPTFLWRP